MRKSKYIMFINLYCWLYRKKMKILAKILYKVNRILFSNDIPPTVKFGKNLILPHYGLGVILHPRSIIGDNCTIYQNLTIGSRNQKGPPIIGNNCLIGAGACVLGNIKIGDDVSIGANAVVIKDVIDKMTVVGIPAQEITRKEEL